MKKNFKTVSLILCIICSQHLNAQTNTTQSDILKNKLIDSICYCIKKTELNSVKNISDASKMFSGCITSHMSLLGDYSNAIGIEWVKITREKLQELTAYVASEVYKSCPAMKATIIRVHAPIDTTKSIILKSKLTDSICICISKTDTSTVNNPKDAERMLSRCILKNGDLMTEYAESTGIDLSKDSNEKTQDLANSIAAEVFRKCAAMKTIIDRVQAKHN